MKVLLPYLAGAFSTFVVQFLIQYYVVPRVQTRRQREERWVKDVLDLGELLTTSVVKLAAEARKEQLRLRAYKKIVYKSEYDRDNLKQELHQREQASNEAIWALWSAVDRVSWISERIKEPYKRTAPMIDFLQYYKQYDMHLTNYSIYEFEDLPESEFQAFWGFEYEARTNLIEEVKKLSCWSTPPRVPWRRKICMTGFSVRNRLKQAFTWFWSWRGLWPCRRR